VALKVEGAGQAAHLSSLVGKSVTVGQSPTVIGGTGKWLVLQPKAAVAAKAVAGAGAAGKAGAPAVMMKLEGARQAAQVPLLAGKTVTVVQPPMIGAEAGKWLFLKPSAAAGKGLVALKVKGGTGASALIGKSFTIGKAPMMAAGASKWLVLHPAAGVAAKGLAGGAVAAKTVALQGVAAEAGAAEGAMMTGLGTAGKGAGGKAAASLVGAASGSGKAAAAGTIWTGKGLSLGLGLGLGVWGPVILGVVGAGAVYGYVRSRKAEKEQADMETDYEEALAEG
jgi:hypothetical protein